MTGTARLRRAWPWLLALAALAVAPLLLSGFAATLLTEAMIFAVFAMSLDLLIGYTGLMSFGHAAFFGLGAYGMIVLNVQYGIDPWIGIFASVVLAMLGAAVIGFFCVRVTGVAFLMLTMAFAQLLYSVALKWRAVTGGSDGLGGIAAPELFGISFADPQALCYGVMTVFVLCFLALRRLVASPLGYVFIGIRENEPRMRAIGYPTLAYKLLAFTIAGGFAGVAGALYAVFNGFISPDALGWGASGDGLVMVVLGGTGTLIGPAIGAAAFLLAKNLVSSATEHWLLLIGASLIACVMFFRQGLVGLAHRGGAGG